MPANPNPIVIGLVGAGFASSFHVENYRRVPGLDIRIKGVTSRSQESATAFARKHQLEQTYESVEALLADPEITLVDLCIPNYLHHPLTLQAAAAGKNIVCEKPLTGFFDAAGMSSDGPSGPMRPARAVRKMPLGFSLLSVVRRSRDSVS